MWSFYQPYRIIKWINREEFTERNRCPTHLFSRNYLLAGLISGPYPERISYRLTGMGAQTNVPKKQKVKFLTLTSLFVKRKFNETHKDFSISYPYNNNRGKAIFSF